MIEVREQAQETRDESRKDSQDDMKPGDGEAARSGPGSETGLGLGRPSGSTGLTAYRDNCLLGSREERAGGELLCGGGQLNARIAYQDVRCV